MAASTAPTVALLLGKDPDQYHMGDEEMAFYWDMFFTFFRIGALTFGGGYTVLPLMQREIVEKRNWAS